jgi:hypothetical protein
MVRSLLCYVQSVIPRQGAEKRGYALQYYIMVQVTNPRHTAGLGASTRYTVRPTGATSRPWNGARKKERRLSPDSSTSPCRRKVEEMEKNIDLNDPSVDPKKLYKDFREWCSKDKGTGIWSFIVANNPGRGHIDLNWICGCICEWAGISLISPSGESNPNYKNTMDSTISLIRAWEACGFLSVVEKKDERGDGYEVYFK